MDLAKLVYVARDVEQRTGWRLANCTADSVYGTEGVLWFANEAYAPIEFPVLVYQEDLEAHNCQGFAQRLVDELLDAELMYAPKRPS